MPPVKAPRVGVVVLNWKRPRETVACLRSVYASDYPALEVVVVDNAANAGLLNVLRPEFPGVQVIENGRNLGYAGGNNVGIEWHIKSGVSYVLLLNDDVEVAPDMVSALVAVGESDAIVGFLGPNVLYFDRPSTIWSAGGAVDSLGQTHHRGLDQAEHQLSRYPVQVDYVSGCAVLVKAAVINAIGPLDERFFAYYEETEWCTRARRAGFRVLCVPSARAWHKIKLAAPIHSPQYVYLMARNRLTYLSSTGAEPAAIAKAVAQILRSITRMWLRSPTRRTFALAGAACVGIADFVRRRYGPPPALPDWPG